METASAVPFEVLPENWDVLQLFIHAQHCKRYAGMNGAVVGFYLNEVEMVRKALKLKHKKRLMRQFLTVINVAINEWTKRKEN